MTPDYRALCAELVELSAPVDSISQLTERLQRLNELADHARALLAEPVAEGPSEKELYDLFCEYEREPVESMRAALARWGRAARRPKPPSLKAQALIELGDVYNRDKIDDVTYDTIRLALEQLDD